MKAEADHRGCFRSIKGLRSLGGFSTNRRLPQMLRPGLQANNGRYRTSSVLPGGSGAAGSDAVPTIAYMQVVFVEVAGGVFASVVLLEDGVEVG